MSGQKPWQTPGPPVQRDATSVEGWLREVSVGLSWVSRAMEQAEKDSRTVAELGGEHGRVARLESRTKELEAENEKLHEKIDAIKTKASDRIWQVLFWVMSTIGAVFITLAVTGQLSRGGG